MRRPLGWLVVRTGLRLVIPMLACASVFAQTSEPVAYAPGAEPAAMVVADAANPETSAAGDPQQQLDQRIAQIGSLLERAHFRTALGVVRTTLAGLDADGPRPQPDERRARLELMAATAEVALGRREDARQSLIRALSADPTLSLEESEVSPKVLELLREARLRTGIEEPK